MTGRTKYEPRLCATNERGSAAGHASGLARRENARPAAPAGEEVKPSRLARGLPELGVPRRLEDPIVGIHGLLVHVEEAEQVALREHGINIDPARAFFAHLKTMDVVARRRKGTNPAVCHSFGAGFSHAERLLRIVIRRLADN